MIQFYMIPEYEKAMESVLYANEHGIRFEYNDFFLPSVLEDKALIEERINTYCEVRKERGQDTMHGAFFDVTVFSYDKKIREVSMLRMRQSMEIAGKMGLRAVIFHGNYLPFLKGERYDSNWLLQTEKAVRELAAEYPGTGIYLENMFEDSPELMSELAKRLTDVADFGICLDYSHALLTSGNGALWFRELSPWIRHMHVNDHCFKSDAHMVPGEGKIDWGEFFDLKRMYAPESSTLCEVTGLEAAKKGITFLKYMEQGAK